MVELAYGERGAGAPTMVLLHGFCDRGAHLDVLAERLAAQHRVLVPDLRGHGDSPAPEGEYTVPALAADVAALCDTQGVRAAVLVGHSLGAAVALELAAQRPDLVSALVALEGLMLVPAALRAGSAELTAGLNSPAWREVLHGFIEGNRLPTDDPAVAERLLATAAHMPQHVVASVAAHVLDWDGEAAAAAVRVPLLYVEATGGLCDLDRLAARCPQLQVGRTVGVGHDQMVATPDQAVAMIGRFVALLPQPAYGAT
jgi:3-oxoadipate enol-lactonase